jgi:hypothetical protein
MRQMMTVSEGVFFAISILCLIFGGFAIANRKYLTANFPHSITLPLGDMMRG